MTDPITLVFGVIIGLLAYTYRKVHQRAAIDTATRHTENHKAMKRLRTNMRHANIKRIL